VSLSAGTTIAERYEIVQLLGSGGMGFVYEVTHVATGHRYALKTIRNDDPRSNAELIKRLLDESKATARIKSEHIVKITDGGIDAASKLPFLVMELLEGTSLAVELARRGRLPAAEVVELTYQASLALTKMHAAGVVHRDLKPENLYLTTRDDGSRTLKVLDFGIAKIVDSSTSAGTTRNYGTPLYMSPEQYRGDGNIDHRADLYSLAQIAFALLTGHAYWEVESRAGPYVLMCKVVEGAIEPATRRARLLGTSLPASIDDWFRKATATQAQQRFEAVGDMVDALGAALGVEVTRDRTAPPPAWRPSPSRARVLTGAAILLLAGAGVATALLARSRARATRAEPAAVAPPPQVVLNEHVGVSVAPPAPVPAPVPAASPVAAPVTQSAVAKKTSGKVAGAAVKLRATDIW
jgi:serine/threonine protein kinase